MQASGFDELAFFRAIETSGARALLIGRRALIALGLPVMTRDYDFWIAIDDAATFNEALRPLELYPTRTPEDARGKGRYVVEGDEHVDVLVARAVGTIDGHISTKKFGARPRDADDIRWLEQLRTSKP
ncbi:MAG: hypothetical protein H0T46_24950 [Deltaproteobacteria bacterium]|nr:hypothetical protein [Deltaproteobacteria bacterium]